jgi:hypothetical protein
VADNEPTTDGLRVCSSALSLEIIERWSAFDLLRPGLSRTPTFASHQAVKSPISSTIPFARFAEQFDEFSRRRVNLRKCNFILLAGLGGRRDPLLARPKAFWSAG